MQQRFWMMLIPICLSIVMFVSAGGCRTSTPVASGTMTRGTMTRGALLSGVRQAAKPLSGSDRDYDALMTLVGDARFVLLGEATHGTHEFYRERARITRRLIEEKGFSAIVIEGDWPDAERVHQYMRGEGNDTTAEQALSGFDRFPFWMWANTDVRDLVQWLRRHNQSLPATSARVGFYGMDVYSLADSSDAVARSLEGVDPQAARRARERYNCFAAYRDEPEAYGLAALTGEGGSCTNQAVMQFQEVQQLHQRAATGTAPARDRRDALFSALQNARVVKNAEEYYRIMYQGSVSSWNLRDRHMADTLDALASHLDTTGRPAKIVVWAHNSHVGDARLTTMGQSGEWNVGQLMRQRHPNQTVLVGFTTYTGTVMAASEWGAPGKRQRVLPALPGSYGALFHDTKLGNFLLPLRGRSNLSEAMGEPRLERAIGVVYLPQTERESHYFQARLSKQFDAVIHFDTTSAVTPLKQR